MSNILKYYKNIFTLMFKVNFTGVESGSAYEAIEKANSDFISPKEWKRLKAKYEKKDPDEFKEALKKISLNEGLKANKQVSDEIYALISDWNEQIDKTTSNTKDKVSKAKEKITNPFNRTLGLEKPRLRGEDVKVLQTYLTNNGFDTNGTEGIFGPGTFRALKNYQRKVLGFRKPDGRMDLNGKTMKYILKDMNHKLSNTEKDRQYGKKANELVTYLNDTDKYLTAYNKVYGGTEDIISRDNGILGIVNRLNGSSLTRLTKELKPDFSKIDKAKLAKELNLPENSPKFKEGLVRIALIAAISAILSGGTTVALELFGINYGENLSKGPEMKKILKALGKGNIDMKKEVRDTLLDKHTTISGLNAILDVLNNPNMDTANLRRFMKEVYQPNWFQDTFGIFLPDGYKEVENLIKKFEKTGTTQDAKAAVIKIYELAHNAVLKAKEDYKQAKEDYLYYSNKYKEAKKDPLFILSTDKDKLEEDYDNSEYFLRKSRKDLEKAIIGLSNIGKVAGRYTHLDDKRAQIQGEKFNKQSALKTEIKLDKELAKLYKPRKLRRVTEKLHSAQSFGFTVDVNKVNEPKYMSKLLTKMNKETINGKTSILAGIMRGVKQFYGIDFTVEEFTNAFMQTAEKTNSKYILSNLGRERNEKFQGKINGNLFKINLNGTSIYFKDKCTNIVTVVNDLVTTVDSTSSVPIIIGLKTGIHKGGNGSGNNGGLHSRPGEEETHTSNTPTIPNPAVPGNGSSQIGGATGGFGS